MDQKWAEKLAAKKAAKGDQWLDDADWTAQQAGKRVAKQSAPQGSAKRPRVQWARAERPWR